MKVKNQVIKKKFRPPFRGGSFFHWVSPMYSILEGCRYLCPDWVSEVCSSLGRQNQDGKTTPTPLRDEVCTRWQVVSAASSGNGRAEKARPSFF